jgi:hypothetical protein
MRWTRKQSQSSRKLSAVTDEIAAITKNSSDDDWRRLQAPVPAKAKSGVYGNMSNNPRLVTLTQLKTRIEERYARYGEEIKKCTDMRCPKGIKCVKHVCVIPGIVFKCKKDEILKAKKCVKACSPGEVLKGSSCVKDCPTGTKQVGNKCVKTCNVGLSLVDGKCKKVCKKDQVLKAGICVKRNPCKAEEKFENGQCTKQCKTDEMVVNGACVKKNPCSKSEILKAGKCTKVCDAGFVLKDGACKKNCETNEI